MREKRDETKKWGKSDRIVRREDRENRDKRREILRISKTKRNLTCRIFWSWFGILAVCG